MSDAVTVAVLLSFDEAAALFEAANVGIARKEELGIAVNEKALHALIGVGRAMGFSPKVAGSTVTLLVG